MLVEFDRALVIALGERQIFGIQEILPLRIQFSTTLKAGEPINLDFSIRSIDKQTEDMTR